MEASFWHEKWELNHIGFHVDKPNPLLINHIDKLKLSDNARLFLPLCGKTLDIPYLLDLGFQVVGIELSEVAIQALFEGLNLTPKISKVESFKLYKAKNIEIYIGDFFDLNRNILGNIDATYDRAALIALPLETRQRYSKHLTEITPRIPQLIISLEYDQSILKGPPFSVNTTELKQHYAKQYSMECVESNYSDDGLKGKYPATESVWILNQ